MTAYLRVLPALALSFGIIYLGIIILSARKLFFRADSGDYYYFHGSSLWILVLSFFFFALFLLAGAKKLFFSKVKINYWFSSSNNKNNQESVYFRTFQGGLIIQYWYLLFSFVILFVTAINQADIITKLDLMKKYPNDEILYRFFIPK